MNSADMMQEALANPVRDDMESFFVPSVTKIKDLLKAQIIKANAEMPGNKTIRVSFQCVQFPHLLLIPL